MLIAYIIFIMLFTGAVLGRIDGGGIVKVPKLITKLCIMVFFIIACILPAGAISLLALLGIFGLTTGHGQYFPSMLIKRGHTAEAVDPIVSLFFGKDPRVVYNYETVSVINTCVNKYGRKKLYYRCAFGMFVTGSLVGLPASIVTLSYGHVIPAILLSLTGFVKALSYVVTDKLYRHTEPAEFLNGLLRNVLTVSAFLYYFV